MRKLEIYSILGKAKQKAGQNSSDDSEKLKPEEMRAKQSRCRYLCLIEFPLCKSPPVVSYDGLPRVLYQSNNLGHDEIEAILESTPMKSNGIAFKWY